MWNDFVLKSHFFSYINWELIGLSRLEQKSKYCDNTIFTPLTMKSSNGFEGFEKTDVDFAKFLSNDYLTSWKCKCLKSHFIFNFENDQFMNHEFSEFSPSLIGILLMSELK